MSNPRSPLARRRLAVLALGVLVAWVHIGLGTWWAQQRWGLGKGDDPAKAMDVRFVQPLLPTPVPPHAQPRPRPRPAPELSQSSAPTMPEPAASQAAEVVTQATAVPADPIALDKPADAPTLDNPSPSSVSEAFDWPPSTQLRYDLTGNYRGPVKGWAEVKWMRDGDRYQVQLELRVPPLGGRRIVSEGLVGPEGLTPRRYDQETDALLRSTLREVVLFEDGAVQLANGRRVFNPTGVQDTASQFVQMTWLFITRPDFLRPGVAVEFPLALPNRVAPWRYEVAEQLPIELPFGEVMAFHLKPAVGLSQPGELSVETWLAPELQYLPVRILLRQGSDTFLELNLKSPPLQEAPPPN